MSSKLSNSNMFEAQPRAIFVLIYGVILCLRTQQCTVEQAIMTSAALHSLCECLVGYAN